MRKVIRGEKEKGDKGKKTRILWVAALASSNFLFKTMPFGEQGRESEPSL